jgi:hypothetical protein
MARIIDQPKVVITVIERASNRRHPGRQPPHSHFHRRDPRGPKRHRRRRRGNQRCDRGTLRLVTDGGGRSIGRGSNGITMQQTAAPGYRRNQLIPARQGQTAGEWHR